MFLKFLVKSWRHHPILEISYHASSFHIVLPCYGGSVDLNKHDIFWKARGPWFKSVLPFPVKTLFALLSSFIFFIIFILNYEKILCYLSGFFSFYIQSLAYRNSASSPVREIPAETTAHYESTLRLNSMTGYVLVMWSTHITGTNPMPHHHDPVGCQKTWSPVFISLQTSALGQAPWVYTLHHHM